MTDLQRVRTITGFATAIVIVVAGKLVVEQQLSAAAPLALVIANTALIVLALFACALVVGDAWPETLRRHADRWHVHVAVGTAAGAALLALSVAIVAMPGTVTISRQPVDVSALLFALFFWLFIALSEELLYRALLLGVLSELIGVVPAFIASSIVFGLAHLDNPGADPGSAAAVALGGGLLFGGAYLSTRSIWVPIRLHLGWNALQGSVLGLAVSGSSLWPSLLQTRLDAPASLTGGAFGLEAGVGGMVAAIAGTVMLAILLYRRRADDANSDIDG